MEEAGAKANRHHKGTATAELLHAYLERGDVSARDRLIELYLPLVESFAHRYQHTEDYDDLFQAGCIGLINAVDRFDLERGGELAAYAVPNIVGEIKRHLRDRTPSVRTPRPLQELRARAVRCEAELGARLQRRPTVAEVARKLGVEKEDVERALSAGRVDPEQQRASLEDATDYDALGMSDDRLALASAFEALEERERQIIYHRFVRDRSRGEVARELGVSERHVTRQTQNALAKLREELERAAQATAPGGRPDSAAARARRPPPASAERAPGRVAPQRRGGMGSRRSLPYQISLVRNRGKDPTSEWTARAEELPGCEAGGDSLEEAVRRIDDAIEEWIDETLAKGEEVPPPRAAATYSGRLMLRMPRSLHAELSAAAQREGVSLNQFIANSLESALAAPQHVGGRTRDAAAHGSGVPRVLRAALSVNLIVLLMAGVVALIILVLALRAL